MYRKTYVEIDCNKLENNIKKIISTYSGYKYYFGVVKNNAYNHGIECIKIMIDNGINYLCVSSLEEALDIRKINKEVRVLVLEPISLDAIVEASKNNITITIDNKAQFDDIKRRDIKVNFHLKIDSGMNRFGLKNKDDVKYIFDNCNDKLFMEGVYTHLSSGQGLVYQNSINKFQELTCEIDLSSVPIVHLDRSLTLEEHDKIPFANGVRLGIIMYGFSKVNSLSWKRRLYNKIMHKENISKPKIDLETIFTFKSQVIEVKDVKCGEVVGYAGMCKADKDMRIAIIPYGFADFLYNKLNNVVINGKVYPTIVINMDVTIVKVDNNVNVLDTVEVFGDNISIRSKARMVGENSYKLLASVTNRVPRVYKYNDEEIEIKY